MLLTKFLNIAWENANYQCVFANCKACCKREGHTFGINLQKFVKCLGLWVKLLTCKTWGFNIYDCAETKQQNRK